MISTFRQSAPLLACIALAGPALSATSMANPAATYCTEQGGEYVIRESDAGQTGFCLTTDGVERDAWQMFREDHAEKVQQTSLANPAATFCVEKGGSYDTGTGNCSMPDGRVVNGWDLFRAEHAGK